jgi:hypothetical protein
MRRTFDNTKCVQEMALMFETNPNPAQILLKLANLLAPQNWQNTCRKILTQNQLFENTISGKQKKH